jgi:excinuclease UvrABC nuclease subunit
MEDTPTTAGTFYCYQKGKMIYARKSANLRQSLSTIFTQDNDDPHIMQLISLTDALEWRTTETLLEALCWEKLAQYQQPMALCQSIQPHQNYVYLAIRFHKVPYLKVEDATIEDATYIGPFPGRFHLWEVIDVLADAFGYPACEDEHFPCHRLKEKKCIGWCVEDQQKIGDILQKNYLEINPTLLTELASQKEAQLEELHFTQADVTESQLRILRRYYRYLAFFQRTKYLEGSIACGPFDITLSHGQIAAIHHKKEYRFFVSPVEYQPNEALAIEKSLFNEAYIVADFVEKNAPALWDAASRQNTNSTEE